MRERKLVKMKHNLMYNFKYTLNRTKHRFEISARNDHEKV